MSPRTFLYAALCACALAGAACTTVPEQGAREEALRAERAMAQAREARSREMQLRAAEAAQAREAQRLADLEREAAEERRRQEAQAGAITPREPIVAQPLEAAVDKPAAAPAAEAPAATPAATPAETPRLASRAPVTFDHGALALELSRDLRALRAEVESLQTMHTPRGWVLSVEASELFEPGAQQLMPGAERKLDRLARVLRHYAARGIVIERPEAEEAPAATDSAPRAEAVKIGLATHGIPAERIAARHTGARVEFLVPSDPAFNASVGR